MRSVFHLTGSDPELVFGKIEEFNIKIVPANIVITPNKEVGLKSFIGIDAHPATAELRPPPAHNIWRHMHDIASAISMTDLYLRKRSRHNGVKMYAMPLVCKEALGGHVHVSMLFDDPDAKYTMEKLNQVYHVGQLRMFNGMFQGNPINKTDVAAVERYVKRAHALETLTPENVCAVLEYLGGPMELWVQPWEERGERMNWCLNAPHYNSGEATTGGNANYLVRWVHSPRPERFPTYAYLHTEWRAPSTWLMHPWLAYMYFAVAKFTMLNWEIVRNAMVASTDKMDPVGKGVGPQNEEFRALFMQRLARINHMGARRTPDLLNIEEAAEVCRNSRTAWFENKAAGVDVLAWRALLG